MNDDRREKVAAKEARQRRGLFSIIVKLEYDGKAAIGPTSSATELCSTSFKNIGWVDIIAFLAVLLIKKEEGDPNFSFSLF